MGSGEKKLAAVLALVLIVLVGWYAKTQRQPAPVMDARKDIANVQKAQKATLTATTTPTGTSPAATTPQPAGATSSAACAPGGASDKSAPTQEFGKKGAKVEIVAALPITHGCHVQTEAELKKAYQAHPKDIHLTIYDLFGKEGAAYVAKNGGKRAVVFINGKCSFEREGKTISLERQEGASYQPSDISPLVEDQLKKK